MSELINYYLNECPLMWGQNDAYLEFCHDYIQFWFPLKEPSNFNPDAPILTEEDILLFKSDPKLKNYLTNSFHRFMEFLGLDYNPTWRSFILLKNFNESMFTVANHNWLRMTRVIKSLHILGLHQEAADFCEFLISNNYGSENSRQYWKEANE